MSARVVVNLAFLFALPAWPQAVPAAAAADEMQVPPAVSGRALPVVPRAELRTNYLSGAFAVHAGYTDNLYPGTGKPISDETYLIDSMLTLNQLRSRQQRVFTYTSGFSLYQRHSQLNQAEHNATALFGYRLSPHANLTLRDVFDKSSNAFGATSPFGGGATGAVTAPGIVVPFADRITNDGEAELTWQSSLRTMVIGSGLFSDLRFPHPEQAPGVFDSTTRGGSASWVRELSKSWYTGVTGQYSRIGVFPHNAPSRVITETVSGFLTLYPQRNLSLSASAGPQRVESGQESGPATIDWAPAIKASVGWQASRATFTGSYSRLVTGGGGLIGSYQSTSGSVAARWLITQRWATGLTGAYLSTSNAGAKLAGAIPSGETKGGSFSLERQIAANVKAVFEYDRLNQNYPGVAAVDRAPDTSRMTLSLSYQFSRPLGR